MMEHGVDLLETVPSGSLGQKKKAARRPAIKSNFSVEIVPPMHVYLLSEHASHVLTGRLYGAVVPYLNGDHTIAQIRAQLSETISAELVDHVIERLDGLGYLCDAVEGLTPGALAFWNELGCDPARVQAQLQRTRISLTAIGTAQLGGLREQLQALGLRLADGTSGGGTADGGADLKLVVTDDYLRPELDAINRTALEEGQPWMLLKPSGSVLWLGPILVPGQTGCWHCLAQRLKGNVEIKASINRQRQVAASTCLPTARPALETTVALAQNWAVTEVAKWVASQIATPQDGQMDPALVATLEGRILTTDCLTHDTRQHALPHRPQCEHCGDPQILTRRGFEPVVLQSTPKRYFEDGGHRSRTPEQTLDHYQHLISPVSGVVMELSRVSDQTNGVINTYKSTHSMGTVGSLRGLRQILRHTASGKGKTDAQARVSGFGEAVERYSFIHQGDEPRVNAVMAELGTAAIHPRDVLHFSAQQYDQREALNAASNVNNDWIPQRFDKKRAIDWTPVWSLTEARQRFLPSAYCYLWYPLEKDHDFCRADSNGNAAGNTIEEAIYQGFLEVVERDAVALWWYNGLRRPRVDLDSFDQPYFRDITAHYQKVGRELWVLDLTADLGIPVMAAVSRRIGGDGERLIIGYGAHLDPVVAITRALTEMSQVGLELDKIPDEMIGADSAEWLVGACLENKPHLVPDPEATIRCAGDFAPAWSDDIRDDVDAAVAAARRVGLEVLVLDLTRPDIGLPVVKVVVPGMRFFWQRFGPGRLYDVPVKLGWLPSARSEAQLNRTSMPF